MLYDEYQIRHFLKKLNNEELYDSEYLLGIDFEKAPIEMIVASLVMLYNNVLKLKSKIEDDSSLLSLLAVDEFKRKQKVLIKLMGDNWIYRSIMRYEIAKRNENPRLVLVQEQK